MIGFKDRMFMKGFIKACTEGDAKRDKDLVFPDVVKAFKDISYGKDPVYNLLDVYRPEDKEGRLPVLISVHGGGYCYGDKELYRHYTAQFCHYGFAVINFNYTLAPHMVFPSPVVETNEVCRWLCENADEYGLDKENVVMIGDSAGAQIASQYATVYSNPEYAGIMGINVPDFKLKAVSLGCGIYSFNIRMGGTQALERIYLTKKPEKFGEKLQVVKYITGNYPPTFIMSSPGDYLLSNLDPMYDLLKERGVKVEKHIYGDEKTYHVFFCDMNNEFGKLANKEQAEFLKGFVGDLK